MVAAVGPGAPLSDVDGTYRQWFATLRASAVLIRPDFACYGAAPRDGGPAARHALVSAARAALAGGTGE